MLLEQTSSYPIVSPNQKMQSARRWLHRFLNQPGTPHDLGMAFAIGTFISVLPTPGLNFVLTTLILARWTRLHRAAMLASLGVWNMAVTTPLYALSMKLGQWLLGSSDVTLEWSLFIEEPLLAVQGFLVGNVVMALTTAVFSYTFVKTAVAYSQSRR